MTTSFADYVAQQDAWNDIQLKVREYCLMLCEALEQILRTIDVRVLQSQDPAVLCTTSC